MNSIQQTYGDITHMDIRLMVFYFRLYGANNMCEFNHIKLQHILHPNSFSVVPTTEVISTIEHLKTCVPLFPESIQLSDVTNAWSVHDVCYKFYTLAPDIKMQLESGQVTPINDIDAYYNIGTQMTKVRSRVCISNLLQALEKPISNHVNTTVGDVVFTCMQYFNVHDYSTYKMQSILGCRFLENLFAYISVLNKVGSVSQLWHDVQKTFKQPIIHPLYPL